MDERVNWIFFCKQPIVLDLIFLLSKQEIVTNKLNYNVPRKKIILKIWYIPTHVLIAINTIEVGVETFSLTLKSKLRIENEQISTPLPVIAEKIPPRKPVRSNTTAFQIPKFGIES